MAEGADGFEISAEWLGQEDHADPGAALIGIAVAGWQAMRAENRWARTVVERVPLSATPLAGWLAQNWWRLRWETEAPGTAWRMAHEVAAAGGGFLWPRLSLVSDGEVVTAQCQPSPADSPEMFRYLAGFGASVGAAGFEAGIDAFMETTLARLSEFGTGAALRTLWREVGTERADPATGRYRRIEAMLGHDPGEGPEALVRRVMAMGAEAGEATVPEIAAYCATQALDALRDAAARPGIRGSLRRDLPSGPPADGVEAAERGRLLAHEVRSAVGLDRTQPVEDATLAGLLGLSGNALQGGASQAPVALAIAEDGGTDRFMFRTGRATGRRFEAARLLCDGLMERHQRWHLSTRTGTARQKVQRAFAAEFLAPLEAVQDYLSGDFSRDAFEGVAEYFDVSSQAITSQLANGGVIPRTHPGVPPFTALR